MRTWEVGSRTNAKALNAALSITGPRLIKDPFQVPRAATKSPWPISASLLLLRNRKLTPPQATRSSTVYSLDHDKGLPETDFFQGPQVHSAASSTQGRSWGLAWGGQKPRTLPQNEGRGQAGCSLLKDTWTGSPSRSLRMHYLLFLTLPRLQEPPKY